MGSENNMVAVPGLSSGYGSVFDRASAIVECTKIVNADPIAALARLASTQPDAQQGEGCPHEAWTEHGRAKPCVDCGCCVDCDQSLPAAAVNRVCATCGFPWGADPVRHAEFCDNRVLATPPSPALDAATIERCAEVAKPAEGGCARQNEYAIRSEIAAAIRALPNAEKRHG